MAELVSDDAQVSPRRMRTIELVAVINSYNRRSLLQSALTSLTGALRDAEFGSAVVVFDAGSTDGSREFLEEWSRIKPSDNLKIISPTAGGGSFSDGINSGCATALEEFNQCKWLLLYETDNWLGNVAPLKDAIALLAAEPQVAAVGFTVRRHQGISCSYGMRFPTALSLMLGLNLSAHWNLDRPNSSPWRTTAGVRWRTCDVVFTSPLLVRRRAWEEVGGFDSKEFPFSDSDLDWAWRAAKLGWKIAVIASGDVVHDNLEQASAWSSNRVVEFHRSRLRLLKRHRGKIIGLIKPFLFIRHGLETILLTMKGKRDPRVATKLEKRKQMLRTVWSDYS